ncbi:hypothetical protein [Allosalinactinospora lopnorensis]|uniref:hypothetical protein n=1 Tax=Allosalinactinospora lopnorensis TaxID=1352348 RepID=UPI000623D7C8|nr:hypothetical protein [Allosalinactinospora lopnorensis]
MITTVPLARRAFLARAGVLGAAVSAGALAHVPAHAASLPRDPVSDVVELLRPALAEFARDTLNGLSVFVVPGPDAYSKAQGTPREEAGAIEMRATDFMIEALDNFVPFPDRIAQPIAAAVATGVDDLGIELPGELGELPLTEVSALDDALRRILENDSTVPLSLAIALLLNLLATTVEPRSVTGGLGSPFARLSFEDKARVFERLEESDADLVETLHAEFPQPWRSSVSGLLRFVAGALLEFPGFGAYSEQAVLDPESRELTERPIGWELTGYKPDTTGPNDGWDDFLGYYEDRTEVSD